jgi:hypothetical protein
VEHVIIGLKLIIAAVISDVPGWVAQERHEEKKKYEIAMDKLEKREMIFKTQGGVVIADQIKQIKLQEVLATQMSAFKIPGLNIMKGEITPGDAPVE